MAIHATASTDNESMNAKGRTEEPTDRTNEPTNQPTNQPTILAVGLVGFGFGEGRDAAEVRARNDMLHVVEFRHLPQINNKRIKNNKEEKRSMA